MSKESDQLRTVSNGINISPTQQQTSAPAAASTSTESSAQRSASSTMTSTQTWSPSSWHDRPILQQPEYADKDVLQKALNRIKNLPPLVMSKEVDALKNNLALASEGKAFLLQGGDCAERFADCNQNAIESKFKILLQMSLIILWGARTPVIRIGRVAGQFAKPRSSPHETVDGKKIPSFKGDNVNSFDPSDREPNPNRLVDAYFHSAATLNYLRTIISNGIADLHDPRKWNLSNILSEKIRKEYEDIINTILDAFNFLSVLKADTAETFRTVDFYTSHEGLLLGYEEALTQHVGKQYYNLGAHYLWIGDRTRQIDGAHVEYFRGIANPIGVKIGPTTKPEELEQLVKLLNPNKEKGRLSLITRYGCDKVAALLPAHINAIKRSGIPVVWICDPCHGNTEATAEGLKTRHYVKIVKEIVETFACHRREGTILGGCHLELTGEGVTECVGGSMELEASHLKTNYATGCDPRLNYTQSLDVAFVIAKNLNEIHNPNQPMMNGADTSDASAVSRFRSASSFSLLVAPASPMPNSQTPH